MLRRRLEDNFQVDVKYITGTDRICLAEDKNRWQAVSTSVNCGLHKRRRLRDQQSDCRSCSFS